MRKLRLSAKERAYMQELGSATLELRYDHERRLRNALLCLAQDDPCWMIWLEKNFKPHQAIGKKELLLIEARAHIRVLRHYSYLGRQKIGEMVFRHDWFFTDNGSLSPG